MSKQPPPAPTASAVGPCPTLIQTSRTPRTWKFIQDHRTTRPPPFKEYTPYAVNHDRLQNGLRLFTTVFSFMQWIMIACTMNLVIIEVYFSLCLVS